MIVLSSSNVLIVVIFHVLNHPFGFVRTKSRYRESAVLQLSPHECSISEGRG